MRLQYCSCPNHSAQRERSDCRILFDQPECFETASKSGCGQRVPSGAPKTQDNTLKPHYLFDGILACAAAACFCSTEGAGGSGTRIFRPSACLSSASSLAVRSLFSFRNCFTFSRPWPMRSPL